MPRERLVHAVVHHLVHQVVRVLRVGVHPRPAADRFQSGQDLDVGGGVGAAHGAAILAAAGAGNARREVDRPRRGCDTGTEVVPARRLFVTRNKPATPDFEAALAELEQIVLQLEQGDLPLEESLRQFERGVALTRNCQKALRQAEQKIRVLAKNADGEPVEQDFAPPDEG